MTPISDTTAVFSAAARVDAAPRRKVAIFEPYVFDTLYGNTRYIATIFRYIDRRQVDPVLVSPVEGRFLSEVESHGGECRVVPAPAPLVRYGGAILNGGVGAKLAALACLIVYALRLALWFKREKVEIVQCHSPRSVLIAGLAARFAGRRVIWYVKSELENPVLDRACFRIAHRIVFQGETNMGRMYPDLIERNHHKISILANGIDLDEIESAERRDRGGLARELGLDRGTVNIVFVGQVVRAKGLDELVDAVARLQKLGRGVALYIVGDHCADEYRGYRRGLETRIAALGVRHVNFTGWRRDVHDIVSLMDVFVLPSHAEGVPKSVIEAMALGKPVLTTAVGSIPDLIEHGETGLLVPARDVDALAAELARLVDEPRLRQRLGDAARTFAFEHCSILRNIQGLERLYGEIGRDRS